ncbi:hypothetical protein CC78DRAFT_578890 [Lojkania enalia]|uniref:Uncharacterized protein n=1 Tax=Lojkania enalia TaxID=147567 RepID=A0A9P4N748_9PLEO|nr:hypothetical protein CC78DRAFT_578890 [Didymosphaeria enalia]
MTIATNVTRVVQCRHLLMGAMELPMFAQSRGRLFALAAALGRAMANSWANIVPVLDVELQAQGRCQQRTYCDSDNKHSNETPSNPIGTLTLSSKVP